VHARDAIDDRKPQPGATAATCGVEARERPQHVLGCVGRNAGTAVEHFGDGTSVVFERDDLDFSTAVAERVVDQIREQSLNRERP
jgi:hypothetical protein